MIMQRNTAEKLRSILGGTFVGIGLHLLSASLSVGASQLRSVLELPPNGELGVVPTMTLAASKAANTYAVGHLRLFDTLLYVLALLWPLVLIIFGAVLLRNILTDKVKELPPRNLYLDKYSSRNMTPCRFHCPSFDV
jgi:hypothetical protein